MIILMSESEINKRCAEMIAKKYHISKDICHYPYELDKLTKSEEPLFIIDLDANSRFQTYMVAVPFAVRLCVREIATHLNDIYLLVSDINLDNRLSTFAYHLAKSLNEQTSQDIAVHVPAVLDHHATLVVPPLDSEQWRIYGIDDEHMPDNIENLTLDAWQKVKHKTLLWEGYDIQKWLDDPQKTYTGIAYSWPE